MSKPVNRQTDRQTDVDKNITLFVLCTLSVEDVKKERDNVVEPVESSEVKSKVVRLLTNVTISFFAILIPPFSLSVCYNGHLSRWTCVSRYRNFSILDFNGGAKDDAGGTVVVTSGATRRAKLQSNCHHQLPTFSRPDVIPVAKPTVSKH